MTKRWSLERDELEELEIPVARLAGSLAAAENIFFCKQFKSAF